MSLVPTLQEEITAAALRIGLASMKQSADQNIKQIGQLLADKLSVKAVDHFQRLESDYIEQRRTIERMESSHAR